MIIIYCCYMLIKFSVVEHNTNDEEIKNNNINNKNKNNIQTIWKNFSLTLERKKNHILHHQMGVYIK